MSEKDKNEKNKLEKVCEQMEYYLSDKNLSKDTFFHQKISSDVNGYVDLDFFLKCNKIIKAGWVKDDLKNGIKLSNELELDSTNERVRRKDNKPLPELTLLNKKRKKSEDKEQSNNEEKDELEPTILKITTKEECKINWKDIINEFKKENPELNVNYGRFKEKDGHISVLLKPGEEIKFKNKMKLEDTEFNIEICENDDLINFWKEHGEHYKNCIKEKKGSKNGKKTKKVVNKNYLDPPIELGKEKYNNIILIKQLARKILNETKDGEKIEGKNAEFIKDILKYHHNYDNKIKDFDHFTTGKPKDFNFSRCFFIVKKNGEKEDFSIQKCIETISEKHSEKKTKDK
jgi:hypothetical protein